MFRQRSLPLLIIFCLLFVFFSCAKNKEILDKSLIAYWPMDEGRGDIIQDMTGNVNDGAIHGAKWNQGGGLEFDGRNDYIRVEPNERNSKFEAITISAWIKPGRCLSEYGSLTGIVTRWNQSHIYGDYYGIWYNCEPCQEHENCYKAIAAGSHEYYLPETIHKGIRGVEPNKWAFVAFVISPAESIEQLYIDNEKVSEKATKEKIRDSDLPIIIGADIVYYHTDNYFRFFNGVIDEVRIYNRALSEDEIKKLYNAGR